MSKKSLLSRWVFVAVGVLLIAGFGFAQAPAQKTESKKAESKTAAPAAAAELIDLNSATKE
jgi:competence protein ComEA